MLWSFWSIYGLFFLSPVLFYAVHLKQFAPKLTEFLVAVTTISVMTKERRRNSIDP